MTHDPFLAMKWEEIEGNDTVFKTRKKEPEGPFFRLIQNAQIRAEMMSPE